MLRWTHLAIFLGALYAACGDDSSSSSHDADVLFPDSVATDSVAGDTSPGDTAELDTVEICSSDCTTVGAKRCDGAVIEVCREQGECLVWQASSSCAAPLVCAQGQCAETCSDGCSVAGARRCDGDGVATCGAVGDCLDWSAPVACDQGQTCSNGNCALICQNECEVSGTKGCDAGGVRSCGDYDDDPCLEWGDTVPCDTGTTCSNGYCSQTCGDECESDQTQCGGGGVQSCGNFDDDPCLEWGDAVACDGSDVCVGGTCQSTCTSECDPVGDQRCATGGYQVCGDPDEDGCLTWGAAIACGPTATCSEGACVNTDPPAQVIISELYYDTPSSDAGTYIELFGPPRDRPRGLRAGRHQRLRRRHLREPPPHRAYR